MSKISARDGMRSRSHGTSHAAVDQCVERFESAWRSGMPPAIDVYLPSDGSHRHAALVELVHVDLEIRLKRGLTVRSEEYLTAYPELAEDRSAAVDLIAAEFCFRRRGEPRLQIDEFVRRFPQFQAELEEKIAQLAPPHDGAAVHAAPVPPRTVDRQPVASPLLSDDLTNCNDPRRTTECTPGASGWLERIGRYRLVRLLGQGSFGRVWLGYDDELQRQVAIKVPTRERFQRAKDAEDFLAEARKVASLDHPNIVPVYDVGRTEDGSVYVVSKFIEGRSLAERIRHDRPAYAASATLLAACARALHHAHQRRLIHRDFKPANILIEEPTGTAYVADFGLAIREDDYLRDSAIAGTPGYMSPEQVRGEGHRLDGRSDIFSAGVVMYELLTGQRPFRGSTANEIHHQVISVDPASLCDGDGPIPVELERICRKAMSKRASERYATAAELADDLSNWRQDSHESNAELKVVPKGLRSFDAHDADFFLGLLPGPRDKDGLPESIRFWKTRIEERDRDQTFSVGLIYGPSGCGKSSLVKAGLLPRLSASVIAVYVEATAEETEARILGGLRKQLPDLPSDVGLVATFAALRRRKGRKVVIVLDQFEQWLHAHRSEPDTELVNALRQCDGVHVQAVIMVRDDFWLAASRFMDSLDIAIVQGQNIALVDLFDVAHAEKVLTMFGRAFGKLPARSSSLSDDETAFLSSVAKGLAQDGKVVSVRLSLFAEMVKGKPWIPSTLQEVGGTEGIGVNFLEETFSSRTANPKHRLHQRAARAVLNSLLPEVGTDIKGQMRSQTDLLASSGYQQRRSDFNELLRVLDGELRLITPTDPEGSGSDSGSDPGSKHYQLTHDFLVSPLRAWLTSKQQETRRGRAELRLAERAALWKSKPENRRLPSFLEFLTIAMLTSRRHWSETERRMMGVAGRWHGVRFAIAAVILAVATTGLILERRQRRMARADVLVNTLVNADIVQEPVLASSLEDYPSESAALLEAKYQSGAEGSRQRLVAAVALLPEQSKVDYVLDRVFDLPPQQARIVLDALITADKDALAARARAALAALVPQKASDDDLDKAARRQALAAIALVRCGDADRAWPLLREGPEARARAYIIHWASVAGADPKVVVARLREETDVSIRRALALMLGEFDEAELPLAERRGLIEFSGKIFEEDPDPGMHAAAEWLLRRWGEVRRLEAMVAAMRPKGDSASASANEGKRWFVNGQGQTLVVLDIGEFLMGSPELGHRKEESPHLVHVGRRVAIAAKLVTKSDYAAFQRAVKVADVANDPALRDIVTTDDSPQTAMTWYEAAQYCNWLSRQEGFAECYEANPSGEFGPGMKPVDGYLQSAGYRLPTEAEWEFACRASSPMSRYYGSSESLLPNYAWYLTNEGDRTRPVGSLKPNDFGLFDMLGNAFQLCDDLYRVDLHDANEDRGSPAPVLDSEGRALRGASYSSHARLVRSAYRNLTQPSYRSSTIGFRVARTLP